MLPWRSSWVWRISRFGTALYTWKRRELIGWQVLHVKLLVVPPNPPHPHRRREALRRPPITRGRCPGTLSAEIRFPGHSRHTARLSPQYAFHALALIHNGLFITADTRYVNRVTESGSVIALSDWQPPPSPRATRAKSDAPRNAFKPLEWRTSPRRSTV